MLIYSSSEAVFLYFRSFMFALLFIQVNLLTRKCRESNKAVEKTDVEAMQITNDPEKRMQDT